MDILDAFWPMLGDLTWRNASTRQIYGIRGWKDYVRQAVNAAPADAPARSMEVPSVGAGTHRTWRITCMGIIGALDQQAGTAQVRKAEADTETASRDAAAETARAAAAAARRRAAVARDQAAAARVRAARERAAARACADAAQAAGFLAAAAQADAEATAADGNAAAADAAAEEHATAERNHRDAAEKARAVSRRCQEWDNAASDASTFGSKILKNEEPIARRMYEGIVQAGGLREVPASKRYASKIAV
jgi:hypothetical protein